MYKSNIKTNIIYKLHSSVLETYYSWNVTDQKYQSHWNYIDFSLNCFYLLL